MRYRPVENFRRPVVFIDDMKTIGASRVMFGTNWPMLSPKKCLKELAGLGLDDAQTEAFLSGNAKRVFGL